MGGVSILQLKATDLAYPPQDVYGSFPYHLSGDQCGDRDNRDRP